jgi:peptidoglycan/LPS O-acetylase OafA/YrhL
MDPPLLRDPRYRMLDAWRGVASLLVVVHHAGFAVTGELGSVGGAGTGLQRAVALAFWRMNLGVPLFFVISGYCIAASVDAGRRRGRGSLDFLSRRLRRIYPPYWAAVLWFVAVAVGLDAAGLGRLCNGLGSHGLPIAAPSTIAPSQWVGNLTLTEIWREHVWCPPNRYVFTSVAWSLCYEEQFYLVCFLALLLAPGRLYGTLTTVTVLAVGLRVIAGDTGRLDPLDGTFPMLWHEFAVGLAVYWRLNAASSTGARRGVELVLLALLTIGLQHPRGTPVDYSTAVSAGFGLVLIALRTWDERSERARWLGPLRACGRRSYSIYLVHLPVCTVGGNWLYERWVPGFWMGVLVAVPVISAAAVGVGWLFFEAVERRFLNVPIVPGDARRPQAGER